MSTGAMISTYSPCSEPNTMTDETVTDMSTFVECVNTTSPASSSNNEALITTIVLAVIVAISMVGIGCSVNYKVLWSYVKKPRAYATGVALQLFVVPLITYGLVKAFQLPQYQALSIMIQGSCPGGSVSNVVVYWLEGIVDLSVVMTATSTLLSLGTMPLWLFIFSVVENLDESARVPFDDLGITLASLIVPLVIGVLINAKFPKKAHIVARVMISISSIAILVYFIYSMVTRGPFFIFTWQMIVIACIAPSIVFILAYLTTLIPFLKLKGACRKTVAIEAALQNTQVAIAVINLSYGNNEQILYAMIPYPVLYYAVQVTLSVIYCLAFHACKRLGCIKASESSMTKGSNKTEPNLGEVNTIYDGKEDYTTVL